MPTDDAAPDAPAPTAPVARAPRGKGKLPPATAPPGCDAVADGRPDAKRVGGGAYLSDEGFTRWGGLFGSERITLGHQRPSVSDTASSPPALTPLLVQLQAVSPSRLEPASVFPAPSLLGA